jgi:pimeloyl-ACP methyl ester carboxylesterase
VPHTDRIYIHCKKCEEKRRPDSEEELPVVLLHGTSGQSEDWSQVVEQLTSHHRPVIRLNYAEPVIGIDSANGGHYTKRQKSYAYGAATAVARERFLRSSREERS